MLKIVTNHLQDPEFTSSKTSLYIAVSLPVLTVIGFSVLNPISVFRSMVTYTSILASTVNCLATVKDDMYQCAKTDTPTGLVIRERLKQLSILDAYVPTFKEYTERSLAKKNSDEPDVTDWTDFYQEEDN